MIQWLKQRIAMSYLKSVNIRDIRFDQDPNACNTGCNSTSWVYGTLGYNISPLEAYQYYLSVEPLRDSVNRIADAASALPLAISMGSDEELLMDHEVLKKIENPGDEVRKSMLLKELVMSNLLTNESWLIMRGNINNPPVGLSYVRPYNISVEGGYDVDGMPKTLRTDSPRDKRTYHKENVGGEIRYFDKMMMNELCPIIGVSELLEQFRGLSPLTSIREELEQIRGGNIHNSGFLKNGMRPSHTVQADATEIKNAGKSYPTKTQLDDFSESLQKGFQGAGNAGKVLTLPFPAKVDDISTTNKDADYLGLINSAETRIYNQYGIPLAIVSEKAMTLDNYTTALVAFYDNAVIENTSLIFSGISQCMRTRFGESDSFNLTFNPHQVKALQTRAADRMEKLRKGQALSTNEIRATAGYEPADGGDEVLVGANLISIGETEFVTFEQDE